MKCLLACLLLTTGLMSHAASMASPIDALHLDWLDRTVQPQNDFYTFSNQGWINHHPIPQDYSRWGSFYILNEQNQTELHELLEDASRDHAAKAFSIEQKVGDFYFSGMNTDAINRVGWMPLKPELQRIAAMRSSHDVMVELAHLHGIGVNALFALDSMQDFKNSQVMIGALMQDGLSLPDRDFYLNQAPRFRKIREAWVDYMMAVFKLLGETPQAARVHAKRVLVIETDLARASKPQEALRDPYAIYHMEEVVALNQRMPHVDWPTYFSAMGLTSMRQVNVMTPEYFDAMSKQLASVSLSDWKIYLRWHLLHAYADVLSTPFVDADFRMRQVLTGAHALKPRWKRVVDMTNACLGFAVGELYVKRYTTTKSVDEVAGIMHEIHDVLRRDLKTLPWMSEATRKAALKKLALLEERVGSPRVWWDYSSLMIDRGPFVLNVLRCNAFLVKRSLNKIGKPVDRSEWQMTPQTVNAYYDPSMNSINIPVGILKSPFYDASAPAAVNFGAIGAVIGHEITHGFDDQGAKFDGHGNLKNWWTAEDAVKFKAATDCIKDQFAQYKTEDNMPVKGDLVVGEATADLGGLVLAYRAFHASTVFKTAKTVAGFTPDQQFFLGYAHLWAISTRPEYARVLSLIDPHPQAKLRVNGTLLNIPAFEQAFPAQALEKSPSKHQACVIW